MVNVRMSDQYFFERHPKYFHLSHDPVQVAARIDNGCPVCPFTLQDSRILLEWRDWYNGYFHIT